MPISRTEDAQEEGWESCQMLRTSTLSLLHGAQLSRVGFVEADVRMYSEVHNAITNSMDRKVEFLSLAGRGIKPRKP